MKVGDLRKVLEHLDDDCVVAVRTGVVKFIAITTIGGKDKAMLSHLTVRITSTIHHGSKNYSGMSRQD